MSRVKAFLTNPLMLASQGFLVGAALLWSNTVSLDQAQAQPVAQVDTARS